MENSIRKKHGIEAINGSIEKWKQIILGCRPIGDYERCCPLCDFFEECQYCPLEHFVCGCFGEGSPWEHIDIIMIPIAIDRDGDLSYLYIDDPELPKEIKPLAKQMLCDLLECKHEFERSLEDEKL